MRIFPHLRYLPLVDGSAEDGEKPIRHDPTQWRAAAQVVIVALLGGILGIVASSVFREHSYASHLTPSTLPLRTLPHTFTYNRSFSEAPSEHTDRSWRSIFPLEGGFFKNAEIAPSRSTFSVFHQLHCLDNIRKSYWVNRNAASRGQTLSDEDISVDIRPSHVRHCIDLLRQSLMCHADTTLEVVDEAINGVHGFRVVHQCRDWDQLVRWASEQQLRQHVEQIV